MTAEHKTVSFAPVGAVIGKCCANMSNPLKALRTIRMLHSGDTERGYVLESDTCDCESRWVTHDWSKGDAVFETIHREGKTA